VLCCAISSVVKTFCWFILFFMLEGVIFGGGGGVFTWSGCGVKSVQRGNWRVSVGGGALLLYRFSDGLRVSVFSSKKFEVSRALSVELKLLLIFTLSPLNLAPQSLHFLLLSSTIATMIGESEELVSLLIV